MKGKVARPLYFALRRPARAAETLLPRRRKPSIISSVSRFPDLVYQALKQARAGCSSCSSPRCCFRPAWSIDRASGRCSSASASGSKAARCSIGAHFKLPWPVDKIYRYRQSDSNSRRGLHAEQDHDERSCSGRSLTRKENFLVANRERATAKPPPVRRKLRRSA